MRVVITGGASGIGKATAEKLGQKGHEIIVLDNDSESLGTTGFESYEVDVRDKEALEDTLKDLEFDVLVNSHGVQKRGAVEDMSVEDFGEHVEANYLGTVAVVKAALPNLKENNGRIINLSSVAGRMTVPFLGAYSGSKYAVEGFSDALRLELSDTEVDVVVVEPGPIDTGFNVKGIEYLENYIPDSNYSKKYRDRLENKDRERVSPEKAADTIVKAVESSNPKKRYTVTWEAWLGPRLKFLLPEALWDRLVQRF